MKKYTDINQFRHAIKTLRKHYDWIEEPSTSTSYPTVTAHGTVKIHGQNAGIHCVRTMTGEFEDIWVFEYQSRTRKLSEENTLNGFVKFCESRDKELCYMANAIHEWCGSEDFIIFGEWAGEGNQSGCGVHSLPKFFYTFDVWCCEDKRYINFGDKTPVILSDPSASIYNTDEFQTYTVAIDLNDPVEAENEINRLTLEVENTCPVARELSERLGIELKNTIGEGIVWKVFEDKRRFNRVVFKTKGLKHQKKPKIKMKATMDPIVEKELKDFIARVVNEERCEMLLDRLKTEVGRDLELSDLKTLMPALFNDIAKEESDAIIGGEPFNKKLVGGAIANAGRPIFVEKINAL